MSAEAAFGSAPGAAGEPVGHYARLQQIEKNVVDAISSASFAMQELAKEQEHIDKHTLHKAVEYFLDQIEEAQKLVLAAIQSAAPDRDFESNFYFTMLQATAAAERLDAVSMHVSGISSILRDYQQQQQQQQQQQGPSPPIDAMELPLE